jgi:putative cyclase
MARAVAGERAALKAYLYRAEEAMKTQLTMMTVLTAGVLAQVGLAAFAVPVGVAAAQELRQAAPPTPASIVPHPSTQVPAHRMTFEQVVAMEQSLSNWGRWGRDDERGTLNLVTPEKTKAALGLVKAGTVVSLARFASLEKTIDDFNFGPTKHEMWYGLAGPPKPGETRGALDTVSYGLHDGTNSHLDALCHYTLLRNGKVVVYNGHPSATEEGCSKNAIDRMGPGFATRAVLVDMPLLKGVEWLDPHAPIYPEDLEAWEKFANVKIGSGDAVLIRTGRWALRAAKGPWPQAREAAGLHASVMPWLKERDIALLGSDAVNDVQPSGIVGGSGEAANRPVHLISIAVMGMPLVDNGYFEDAAREAATRKQWEFFMTVQLTGLTGGTATNFNALGIF